MHTKTLRPNVCLLLIISIAVVFLVSCQSSRAIIAPEGWLKHESPSVSIWLPPEFESYMTQAEFDDLIATLRTKGEGYDVIADDIAASKQHIAMLAYDREFQQSGCSPSVVISSSDTIRQHTQLNDDVIESVVQQFQEYDTVHVLESKQVSLERFGAGRIVLETNDSCRKGVTYIIPWGSRYWLIAFWVDVETFDEQVSMFEQSIATFDVKPEPDR